VAEFKYLGKTLTDGNCMCEEMKQQMKLRERYRMFCVLVAVQEDERYRVFCVLVAVQEGERYRMFCVLVAVQEDERYRMFCVLVAVQEDERYRMFCVLVAVQEDGHYNILSVVLYGCGTWYVTVKKEHRLSVLENTVLRETFGSKEKEGTGGPLSSSSSSLSSSSWSDTN